MSDRPIQVWLFILGCAALVVIAVLVPYLVLRPATQVSPLKDTPRQEFPSERRAIAHTPANPPAAPTAQESNASETLTKQAPSALPPNNQTTATQSPDNLVTVTPPLNATVPTAPPSQAPAVQTPPLNATVPTAPPSQTPTVQTPSRQSATSSRRRRAQTSDTPNAQAPEATPPASTTITPTPTPSPNAIASESPPSTNTAPNQAPAMDTSINDAENQNDGLTRGQRFKMVEDETLKELGPEASLGAALAKSFAFPHKRDDVIFGIDVSYHNTDNCQCKIDWDEAANQKVAFVYLKASEGVWFRDPRFAGHWKELGAKKKIIRGAYHFMSADDDPTKQAEFFLAGLGKLEPGDLPPAVDLEWDVYPRSTRKWSKQGNDYWSELSPDDILDRVLTWLKVVEEKTGVVPVIYTSRVWWKERIKDETKLERIKRYPIWISATEDKDLQLEKPGARGGWTEKWNWKLWQFTFMGDLSKAGIDNPKTANTERVDVSMFPGTLAEFQQTFALNASVTPPKKDEQAKVDTTPKPEPEKTPEPPKQTEQAQVDTTPKPEPEKTPEPPKQTEQAQVDTTPKPEPEKTPEPPKKIEQATLEPSPNTGPSKDTAVKTPVVQSTRVEIVLSNGRIIRVDSMIDPDVLSRLVSALDSH